jgi:hypothetical protein
MSPSSKRLNDQASPHLEPPGVDEAFDRERVLGDA